MHPVSPGSSEPVTDTLVPALPDDGFSVIVPGPPENCAIPVDPAYAYGWTLLVTANANEKVMKAIVHIRSKLRKFDRKK